MQYLQLDKGFSHLGLPGFMRLLIPRITWSLKSTPSKDEGCKLRASYSLKGPPLLGLGLASRNTHCFVYHLDISVGCAGLKKEKVQNFLWGKKTQIATEQFEKDKILCTYVNIYLHYIYTQHTLNTHTQSFT